MTVPGRRPAVHVTADLHVDVDGVPAQVSGDGQRISVTTDRPWRLLGSTASPSRAGLSAIADRLADSGLTVELAGPRGAIAEVGAGVESPLGRLVTGTSRARALVDRRVAFTAAALAAVLAAIGVRSALHR